MSVNLAESIPPRGVRLYRLDEPICCARGHKFSETAGVVPHGWLQCTKRVHAVNGRVDICGEFVYVVDFHNGHHGVARIDWREAYRIKTLQLSVDEAAEFLQLPWARRAG